MFERLGSFAFRWRFPVLLAWILAAGFALAFAPSLAKVGSTDESSFLPSSTESMQARRVLERAFPADQAASVATIAFTRASGLTDADRSYIDGIASWIVGPDAPDTLRSEVSSVDTPASRPELASMLRSPDGALELVNVNLTVVSVAGGAGNAVGALRAHLSATAPAGLRANVTGAAGISSDYLSAILRGTDSTTLVTVVLVVLILLLIYRAPLAALVPLATIGAAFLVSRGVLGYLAEAGWKISSLLDTFVVVLVFGVGTDYTIFLISRFREEVSRGDWHAASTATVRRIGAVISASAATVIVGLGSMAFGQFEMIQTTGPALAITIAITLVAGLTLAPALLGLFGHYLFWPRHERDESTVDPRSLFARLAAAVSRRPGLVTIGLLAALLVPVAALPAARTNFDILAELPKDSDARIGFEQVAVHLGKGRIMPLTGVVEAGPGVDLLAPASLARLRGVTQALARTDGVQTATSVIAPSGDGTVPEAFQPSKQLAAMAASFRSSSSTDPAALLDAKVSDGIASASSYVTSLAPSFPDVASGAAYGQARSDLATAPGLIGQLRQSGSVSAQLRSLATLLGASTVAGGDPATSMAVLAGYLRELAAAYPDLAATPAFGEVMSAAAALQQAPGAATLGRLSTALTALAVDFDARPDAVLFPKSLPATPESTALTQSIAQTFGRLPGDLQALSAVFAARSDDLFIPTGLKGDAGTQVAASLKAFLSSDRTVARLYVTTSDDPYSTPAFDTVRRVRDVVDPAAASFGPGTAGHVGGATAELSDIQTTLGQDFRRVAVITVLGVLLVLIVLLRALVAPIYLVLSVLLSYLSAIGLTSWLYQSVLGQPGINYYLPLMVFVLLVALGSDYNIFLMSRVREESETRPIREGIRLASGRTGAVITSAGIILAGTFGSMATAPLIVLFQVGVAVAVGVLLDTFVVRSILVPAITTLAGDRAWWPSRRGRTEPAGEPQPPRETGAGEVAAN